MTSPEPQLARSARNFTNVGARVLLLGGIIAALGGLLYLLGTDGSWVDGLGGMLAWLAVPPTVLGLVLLVISRVTHRASEHKPFA